MKRSFEIHFFQTKGGFELVETSFKSSDGQIRKCIRGKTAGAFRGAGSFQWTSAVKAIAALCLRHVLSQTTLSVTKHISGGQASLAASLDYALTKAPCWISEMFGVHENKHIVARRLFLITNPNRKRPGPVIVAINDSLLSTGDIHVFLNGHPTTDFLTLLNILCDVEIDFPGEHCDSLYGPIALAS